MRAAVLEALGAPLVIEQVPDPSPGPGELVLRVAGCGICGSDLHMSQFMAMPGLVMGHEYAGEVVAVGAGVDGWGEGDRVAAFPVIGCGTCDACRAGVPTRCPVARMLGILEPGGFAEYARVGASLAHRLPDSIEDHYGALVEPLAVALHALDRTPRASDEPVLVLGGGPIGLAVALWVRSFGAEVVVSDPAAARRDLAERVAGAATVDPRTDDVGAAFARVTGHGPSVVFECVGIPGLISQAVDVVQPDGHVTVVGVCMEPDPWVPVMALMKEVSLGFTIYYRPRDFARTIRAIESGRLDPTGMVTGVVGLDAMPEAFEALRVPSDQVKVIVDPRLTGATT